MTIGSTGRLAAGAAIGVVGGIALGAYLDSVIVGVAVGVGAGATLGVLWAQPAVTRRRGQGGQRDGGGSPRTLEG